MSWPLNIDVETMITALPEWKPDNFVLRYAQ